MASVQRQSRHPLTSSSSSSSCLVVLGIACLVMMMIDGGECKPLFGARRRLLGEETIFNVKAYGAKGDGRTDDSLAIIKAWKAACESSGQQVKVVIPSGSEFMAGEIVLSGPCNCTAQSPITVEIQGTLSANSDPTLYTRGVWISIENLDHVVVTGGGTINGKGKDVWEYADGGTPLPVSLVFRSVGNGQLRGLKFVDSMGFHAKVTDSHDFDVSNLTITAPDTSPNTDGIHISNATNINIIDSFIGTGDDCVSIGHGSVNVLVQRIVCGPGHGISIGSLGKRVDELNVKGITVVNCTLNGTTNGARIKTFQDSPQINATGITYKDILMTGVKNPIIIDQHYESKNRNQQSSVKISDVHFINISGTTVSPVAVSLNCSSTYPCEGIELKDINLAPDGVETKTLESACSNAQQLSLAGTVEPAVPKNCV